MGPSYLYKGILSQERQSLYWNGAMEHLALAHFGPHIHKYFGNLGYLSRQWHVAYSTPNLDNHWHFFIKYVHSIRPSFVLSSAISPPFRFGRREALFTVLSMNFSNHLFMRPFFEYVNLTQRTPMVLSPGHCSRGKSEYRKHGMVAKRDL